jgi:hypothetical protein
MTGGGNDLGAIGAQDAYLTIVPMMTFWKGSYKRYTAFAMQLIRCDFNSGNGLGGERMCELPRSADLVFQVFLMFKCPGLKQKERKRVSYVQSFGFASIVRWRVDLGTNQIDEQDGLFLDIMDELCGQKDISEMVGKFAQQETLYDFAAQNQYYYVPAQFWFCLDPRLTIPMNALQYNQVKMTITTRPLNRLVQVEGEPMSADTPTNLANVTDLDGNAVNNASVESSLLVNYVFLDQHERKLFAVSSHEYLIRVTQSCETQVTDSSTMTILLQFNHPVIQFMWVGIRQTNLDSGHYFDYSDIITRWDGVQVRVDPFTTMKFEYNNQTRVDTLPADVYRKVQPYMFNTNVPSKHVYANSFALYPEDPVQPSGSLNFSRIDRPYIKMGLQKHPDQTSFTLNGVAKSIAENVLRVLGGMAGLAFSS